MFLDSIHAHIFLLLTSAHAHSRVCMHINLLSIIARFSSLYAATYHLYIKMFYLLNLTLNYINNMYTNKQKIKNKLDLFVVYVCMSVVLLPLLFT